MPPASLLRLALIADAYCVLQYVMGVIIDLFFFLFSSIKTVLRFDVAVCGGGTPMAVNDLELEFNTDSISLFVRMKMKCNNPVYLRFS